MPPKKFGRRGRQKKEDPAKAEERRRQEEERLAEEARQKALAEEKAKFDADIKEFTSNPDGERQDLMKWLNSVPLSRRDISRVDRAFSDGVLVAELVAYYCPDLCDTRHFHEWYSTYNKELNWRNLNRTVFPQLGFSLTQDQIDNLVKPWGKGRVREECLEAMQIYKVLRQVLDGIGTINPAVFDYRKEPNYKDPNIVPYDYKEELPQKPRKPRVDVYTEGPPYSKVEMLLHQGFYDEKEVKKRAKTAEKNIKDRYKRAKAELPKEEDWVKFGGCGGEFVVDFEHPCPYACYSRPFINSSKSEKRSKSRAQACE